MHRGAADAQAGNPAADVQAASPEAGAQARLSYPASPADGPAAIADAQAALSPADARAAALSSSPDVPVRSLHVPPPPAQADAPAR